MSTIAWVETIPSDGSAVAFAPTEFPSHWSAIATWMNGMRLWPVTGGGSEASIGEMKNGGALAFFGAKSASSNTVDWYHRARAFFDSGTTRLYTYDSSGTYLIGTPFGVDYGVASVGGQRFALVQSGSTAVAAGVLSLTIPFPLAYSPVGQTGLPVVMVTFSGASIVGGSASTVTGGGFTSTFSYFGPATQPASTLYWTAFGSALPDVA